MSDLFLRVFNVAVTAGWIVPACLLLRVVLRGRLPGWVRCALWSVVGIRLLLPFSLESIFSLIPSAQTVPPTITTAPMPQVNVGVPPVDAVINPVISQTMAPKPQASVNPMQVVLSVGTVVWLVGVAVMLLVLLVNGWRLRRILQIRRLEEKGVYVCDIDTRFDNCRADEHVYFTVDKLTPYFRKLLFVKPSVCNSDSCFGEKLLQSVGTGEYVVDSVVNVVNLTATP